MTPPVHPGQRNAGLFLAQGILFFAGVAFIDSTTVLPLFIERFTGHAELAGAAAALRTAATLVLQFAIGLAVPRIRNLPRYLGSVMLAGYTLPALMVPLLLLTDRSSVLVTALLVIITLLWVADGAIVIAWYDLFGRTVPARGRGRILGFQQLFGGAASVLAALAIKLILDADRLGARVQYALVFLCAAVMLALSASTMLFTRDVERKIPPRGGIGRALRRIPGIWSTNGRYRALLVTQALFALATMCAPHLLLFAKNWFGLRPSEVTWLIGIQVAGSLAGGLAAAVVAPRWGNGVLVGIFAAVSAAIPCAALAAHLFLPGSPSAWPVLAGMMLLSGIGGAAWVGFGNRAIDILAPEDIPPGMAAVSLVSLPLSVAPYVAGLVAARTGYAALLWTCAALGVAALAVSLAAPRVRAAAPETRSAA
jgi:MFS family permease